jgi:hypothetical protein
MLRDDSIYLKLSTEHDLLHDATFLEMLEILQALNQGIFEQFQDLMIRGRPRAVTPALLLEELHRRVGAGLHQAARVRLSNGPEAIVRACELHAGAHPYAGRFVTQLDVRLSRGWFVRNPAHAPRIARRRLIELAALSHPFQGHAHDTDDNAMQNVDSAALLRRGFGVEPPEPFDPADNPGRERSRGAYRYVVNWLTLIGPGLLEHLGEERVQSAPADRVERLEMDPDARVLPAEEVARRLGEPAPAGPRRWWLLQVGASPLDADLPAVRATQRAVRDHLDLPALAASERWVHGYWQRKP